MAIAIAPTSGEMKSRIPNATERMPESTSSHSPSICLRSRIAATISATPVTSDHAATHKTSASAVSRGQKSVMKPTRMLTTPSNTSAPQRWPARPARTAATRLKMPSTTAYAPNTATRAAIAPGGQNSATRPKRMAAAPRKASAHQFCARLIAMGFPFRARRSVDGRLARCTLRFPGGGRALDLDSPPPRELLGHRNGDFEHAVFESRLRLARIGAVGKRDFAREAAVRAFGTVYASLAFHLDLGAPLAFDDERVVRRFDAHVVRRKTGQIRTHDKVSVALEGLDRGRPNRAQGALGGLRPAFRLQRAAGDIAEEPIHVFHHPAHEREGAQPERPDHRRHRAPLQCAASTATLLLAGALARLA